MKTDTCNHRVPFVTSLLVTNPHNYPCPHCHKRLTLDTTGRRHLRATVATAGTYGLIIGTLSILAALQAVGMRQITIINLIGLAFGLLLLLPMTYIAWKRSRFIERKKLESVRHSFKQKVVPEKMPFRYRLIFSPSNT